jgi:hypothetical protein
MKESINGCGCVIAIDKNGIFGKEMNSTAMLWATVESNELKKGMDRKKVLGMSQQRPPQDDLEDEVQIRRGPHKIKLSKNQMTKAIGETHFINCVRVDLHYTTFACNCNLHTA